MQDSLPSTTEEWQTIQSYNPTKTCAYPQTKASNHLQNIQKKANFCKPFPKIYNVFSANFPNSRFGFLCISDEEHSLNALWEYSKVVFHSDYKYTFGFGWFAFGSCLQPQKLFCPLGA